MDIKQDFYSPQPLIDFAQKENCPFIGILGGKGNGKTYGLIWWGLKQFMITGRIMRYLRRYDVSIKPKAIQSLCNPQQENLRNLTNGKYNAFQYYQNRFYLIRMENGERVDKMQQPFMICSALNSLSAFTGADEGECSCIFYDEVMSRKEQEIPDEYLQLMIFHDNCTRNRTDYFCPMFLVGNTFTRNSIIIQNFGVDLYKSKQGQITVVRNKDKQPTFIFEHCADTKRMQQAGDTFYARFQNDHLNMIYKGEWTVGNYPLILHKFLDSSKIIARVKIVTPSKIAVSFEIRCISGKNLFAYVCKYANDNTPYDALLLNKTQILNNRTFNYLPQHGIFKQFVKLIYTKNTYFENFEIGEYFRDFLRTFLGCERLKDVYQ